MNGTVRVHAGAAGTTASVTIQSSPSKRFVPQIVEVQPGGAVAWTNVSFDDHTVTSN
jgi:plastocyanin